MTTQASRQSVRIPEGDTQRWTYYRLVVANLLEHRCSDTIIGVIIAINVGVIATEADLRVACEEEVGTCSSTDANFLALLPSINRAFLSVYILEAVVRLYAYRLHFFHCPWNLFDGFVVLVGIFDAVLGSVFPNIQFLRVFRIFRLLRAIRVLSLVPELHSMIMGFTNALCAMFWGFVMIIIAILLWSILAVEVINPRNTVDYHDGNSYCELAFSSVSRAGLLFFQTLVAGDSWGHCAIPILLRNPHLFFVFAGAYMSVQLGFMNLVLSVIVDRSSEEREKRKKLLEAERCQQSREVLDSFMEVASEIDEDGSGQISFEEFKKAVFIYPAFQDMLASMDLDLEAMRGVFAMSSGNGEDGHVAELSYIDLLDALRSARASDLRTQVMGVHMGIHKLLQYTDKLLEGQAPPACKNAREDADWSGLVEEEQGAAKATPPKSSKTKEKIHPPGGLVTAVLQNAPASYLEDVRMDNMEKFDAHGKHTYHDEDWHKLFATLQECFERVRVSNAQQINELTRKIEILAQSDVSPRRAGFWLDQEAKARDMEQGPPLSAEPTVGSTVCCQADVLTPLPSFTRVESFWRRRAGSPPPVWERTTTAPPVQVGVGKCFGYPA